MSYEKITKEAKLAARDNLRAEKVSKWTGRKSALEREIKAAKEETKKTLDTVEHAASVVDFEAANTPEAHPNKTAIMEKAAENRKKADEKKVKIQKDLDEYLKETDEQMKEIVTAITEWEEGKRLVSKDDLKTLTRDLLKKHFTEEFLAGTYAETATPAAKA